MNYARPDTESLAVNSKATLEPYSPEWLSALGAEELKAVFAGPFGTEMLKSTAAHVTWLLWEVKSRRLILPRPLFRQASVFLLDCGQGTFAVTAGHVYRQYQEDLNEGG